MKPWKKISDEVVHEGRRKIVRRMFELPDGRVSDFEVIDQRSSVCVLALTDDDQVVLAQQFRAGPEEVFLELPGGVIDVGEDPLVAIARELREETGYAGEVEHVATSWASAFSTARCYHFVARHCRKVDSQKLDPEEFIEVVKIPLADFRRRLKDANFTDFDTALAGLHHLGLL